MNRSFISKVLFSGFFILLLPFAGWAEVASVSGTSSTNTFLYQKKEPSKEKPQEKKEPVKTVPKSHKQERPSAPSR